MSTKYYVGILMLLSPFLFFSCADTTDKTKAGMPDTTYSVAQLVDFNIEMGKALDKKGEYRSAIECYTDAIKKQSRSLNMHSINTKNVLEIVTLHLQLIPAIMKLRI